MTITNPYAYIAVRMNPEGREWADVYTTSGDRNVVQMRAASTDAAIPEWARSHPVVRVAKFRLEEMS